FPWGVAIDDMNRDGNLDLVVIPYDRDITDPKRLGVTVLLGDGKGGFTTMRGSPFSLAGCQGPDRVATGDINGDGFRDIVVSCAQNDKLILFMGSKDGTFQISSRDVQTGWSGLAVADLDGDGKDDVVVSNNAAGTITIFFSK
ncbi:MAG: VCBS repeat-containing protein, partial [Candidatus Acidiferrales bacterium]